MRKSLTWLSVLLVLLTLFTFTATVLAQGQLPDPPIPQAGPAGQAPSTLNPGSEQAQQIAALFNIVFIIGVAVFILVQGLLIYSMIRFRRRTPDEQPKQIHGNTQMEIAWTIGPALILVTLLAFTLRAMNAIAAEPDANALRIEVIGHQWWWEFRYPAAAPEHALPGRLLSTSGEMHIPSEVPVRIAISSTDVIHSYWVPQLGGKTDAIPNHINHQNIFAQLGTYAGQCAEFCGAQHALMRFMVVSQSQSDFDAWVANQQLGSQRPTSGPELTGYELFFQKTNLASGSPLPCIGCHTVRVANPEDGAKPALGLTGPELTHFASRQRMIGGAYERTPEMIKTWLRDPQKVKPEALMRYTLTFTDAELDALTAYLQSLK